MKKADKNNAKEVLKTLRHVLRPVVRLMLANGITLPTITEMLKKVLVEVAEDDFASPGKATTDSRISVLTGVHRKDVRRLRYRSGVADTIPESVSLGSRIVNTWISQASLQDKRGVPLPLPRVSSRADQPSFEQLAASVSTDVRPRAMLDELLRLGIVRIRDDGSIELQTGAFVPSQGDQEKLYYLSRAAYAHLSAAVHNVIGNQPPFFERVVHYDTIPEAVQVIVRGAVEKEGMRSLRAVNKIAQTASDPDQPDVVKLTYGVYFHTEPRSSEEDGK